MTVVEVSNADRVVFPAVGKTKGDVVAYYETIAARALPHLIDRPLSIRRYPKGLAGPGFFQKNVPDHYPESIGRFAVPRSKEAAKRHPRKKGQTADVDVTNYPVLKELEHLPYVANQGAIELHVPTARIADGLRPDRVVIDLDPPENALGRVRQAARLARELLESLGLPTVPVATGSKGYHVVAAIVAAIDPDEIGLAMQKVAELLARAHPEVMTTEFRIANRGERVFVDWMRNRTQATVVAPYSVRARAKASVAAPLSWDELDELAPDAFTIDDAEKLRDRPDTLADLAKAPTDATPFVAAVDAAFAKAGLELVPFDRFRS